MVDPPTREGSAEGSAAANISADLARALRSSLIYRFADPAHVAAIQRHHVRLFAGAGAGGVLDLACGRGIFLELLRAAGIVATGVDSNPEAVAECHEKGFTAVAEGDVLEFLASRRAAGAIYAGIYCSHLIEHLSGEHGLTIHASFDDPRTRRNYLGRSLWRLPVDFLRYGLGMWSGMDSVVVGEKREG